jgi:hypothetical protein
MMRAAASLHAYKTGRKSGREIQHLAPAYFPTDDGLALTVNPVHLKHVPCEIETYCRNVH